MRLRTKPANEKSRIHTAQTISPKQAQRMASGQIESSPEETNYRISSLDRERRQVRLALEDRRLEKELERMCGSGYE